MFKFYWKSCADVKWEEISELELHAKLYKHVKQTTPIIKEMLKYNIYILSNEEQFKIRKHTIDPNINAG